MTDEEYRKLMHDLVESGRAFDALKYLTELVSIYTNNLEVCMREIKADRRAMKKFMESDLTAKRKLEAIAKFI